MSAQMGAAMKPVVLILGNSDSGLYDFRKELLEALLKEGYEVRVSVPDTGYVSRLKALGCSYHPVSMERRGMNPAKDLALFRSYVRLLRQVRPAVVLTYTIKPNIYGGLACRLTRRPYLVNITGLGTALEHGGLLQKMLVVLYRLALSGADCIFFQNERNRQFMQEKGCVKKRAVTRILPGSGVNVTRHTAKPYPAEGKIHFLSVLRIMQDKGIEELMEAAGQIHAAHPETVFDLLGSYEEETKNKYQPRLEDLQKRGIIQYYGYRDDVPAFYESCHALIHPSYHEGMSNVLLEAAATARPVLASDIPGCRETFVDGVSGFSFPPGDAQGLTQALERFLALTHEERKAMGEAGRAYVEANFDRTQVVKQYLKAIAEAVRA